MINAINEARLRAWARQPDEFLEEATLDADGTIVETDAECKQGVDIAYNGKWGYHPLLIWLANTAEPLYLLNRRRACTDDAGRQPGEQLGVYLRLAERPHACWLC